MSEIKLPEPAINTMGTDGWSWWPVEGYTAEQMRAAILEERERCALLIESMMDATDGSEQGAHMDFAYEIGAAAIRSQ